MVWPRRSIVMLSAPTMMPLSAPLVTAGQTRSLGSEASAADATASATRPACRPSARGASSTLHGLVPRCLLSFPARALAALVLLTGVGCSFIPPYTAPSDFQAATFLPSDTWLFGDVTLRPA